MIVPPGVSSHLVALLALLFWTALAVGVGVHAMDRRRSGFLWGLLTFVTGLVGLLIYVVVAGTAADTVDDDDGRFRRCPGCSTRHDGEPNYCSSCGDPLDAGDDVVAARVLRSGSRGYCSHCKTQVSLDADACGECGAVF